MFDERPLSGLDLEMYEATARNRDVIPTYVAEDDPDRSRIVELAVFY